MDEKKLNYFDYGDRCPIRDVLSRIGDKWSILVLATLRANNKLRFSEIKRTIGDISQRMLTVTLRSLEADGIVTREVYPEVPPRVEYELTDLGNQLFNSVSPLVSWAESNMETIIANRTNYKQ